MKVSSGRNILYKYPQSSCDCYAQEIKPSLAKEDRRNINLHPTNISLYNDQIDPNTDYSFYNPSLFSTNGKTLQTTFSPTVSNSTYNFINPQMSSDLSPDFFGIPSSYPPSFNSDSSIRKTSDLPETTNYISPSDPRLINPIYNMMLRLDKPPTVGGLPLDKVYEKEEKTSTYGTYRNIKLGDMRYYIDNSIKDALYKPVYDMPAIVDNIMYKDPMDNYKPQYIRKDSSVYTPSNSMNNTENPPLLSHHSLSFISDTSEAREQLIARQQLKNNQQKWSARWGDY